MKIGKYIQLCYFLFIVTPVYFVNSKNIQDADEFISELLNKCPNKNIQRNESLMDEMQRCICRESENMTSLEIFKSDYTTELQFNRFQIESCEKWPKISSCLVKISPILNQCYNKDVYIEEVLEAFGKFFCDIKNFGRKLKRLFHEQEICFEEITLDRLLTTCNAEYQEQTTLKTLCEEINFASSCAIYSYGKCMEKEISFLPLANEIQKIQSCPITSEFYKPVTVGSIATAGVQEETGYVLYIVIIVALIAVAAIVAFVIHRHIKRTQNETLTADNEMEEEASRLKPNP